MSASWADPFRARPPVPTVLTRVWRVRDVVGGFLAIPASIVLVSIALIVLDLSGVLPFPDSVPHDNVPGASLTLLWGLIVGAIVPIMMWRRGLKPADIWLVWPERWRWTVFAWLGVLAIDRAYGNALSLAAANGLDIERFDDGNPVVFSASPSSLGVILAALAIVVVYPVSEELLFRGLLFRGLRGFWPILPAALLSGLCFGLYHFNLSVLLPFSLGGLLWAWANEKSGSLVPSIVAHSLNNAAYFVLTLPWF